MIKRYEPTEWQNRVTDVDGTVLQDGTPLTAENMNKLEQQVAELANERGQANGTAPLDENGIVPARHLPSQVKEMRVVANIASRNALERFEGLRVLVTDATADTTVKSGWAEYVYDGTKYVKVGEGESLDIAITWADIQGKPTTFAPSAHKHTEADITDLDKYTKAQVNALLQGKSNTGHTHSEFASITQLVNKVQALEQANEQSLHGHSNKSTLDKLTYSGAKPTIDLNKIDELEGSLHSHENASTLSKIRYSGAKPTVDLVDFENKTYTKSDVGLGNVDNVKQMPLAGGVLENYREKLVTLSATLGLIDLSQGNVFEHTPSANITYSFSNASNQAHSFTLIVKMGATLRTLTFPSSVKWQSGETPSIKTLNKTYVLTFMTTDGGTTWFGINGGEF